MRVIAGRAKGRKLLMVPGEGTRPITDRAKEALFSILSTDVISARVLDLFAGTGGVGIEALSRGAAQATFVEREGKAVATLRQNLVSTGLDHGATVVRADAFRFLESQPTQPYDLIFIAPPQYQGLWLKTLQLIDSTPAWLASGGQAIVQIFPKEFVPNDLVNLTLTDERRYGSVLLLFYNHAHEMAEDTAS